MPMGSDQDANHIGHANHPQGLRQALHDHIHHRAAGLPADDPQVTL